MSFISVRADGTINKPWLQMPVDGTIKGYWENVATGGTTGQDEATFSF